MRAAGSQDLTYQRILAKTTNESSETYDVLTSDGYVRRGSGSFVDLCRPAWFPRPARAGDSAAGERLPRALPAPGDPHRLQRAPAQPRVRHARLDAAGRRLGYCAAIGYTDGRSWCPVRTPGDPERVACEVWRVGTAKDTGRPGPTWTKDDGSYCTGLLSNGCENSPDNQFQLRVYAGGTFVAAAANGVSCSVVSGR